jgi:single-stranded DNA-specific DHH superfamily exonuclease
MKKKAKITDDLNQEEEDYDHDEYLRNIKLNEELRKKQEEELKKEVENEDA